MVAMPFHCSSGSELGFDTRAPSISPAARSPINSALDRAPVLHVVDFRGSPDGERVDHRAEPVGGRARR